MNELLESPPEAPPKRVAPWGLVVLALLAGYLLFAHGCHGDEDNELFASAAAVAK
jgi:MYXO-CTERM domain-containing protein